MKKPVQIGAAVVAILIMCAFSGAIGSAIAPDGSKDTYNISYADFVVIMLTAVSVMVTVLALIVGVAAYIGWNSIQGKVKAEVKSYLKVGFKPGKPLHELFVEEKYKASVSGVQPLGENFDADVAAAKQEGDEEF